MKNEWTEDLLLKTIVITFVLSIVSIIVITLIAIWVGWAVVLIPLKIAVTALIISAIGCIISLF